MSVELKEVIEKLGTAFEEFKKANDERLKQIEEKGKADVLVEERVDKLSKTVGEMDTMKTRLERLELAQTRPPAGGGVANEDELEHRKAFRKFLRKGNDTNLRELEAKAMSVDDDPSGGYLVPSVMQTEILTLLAVEVRCAR